MQNTQKSRPAGAAFTSNHYHHSAVDTVLQRLEKVRKTGPDKWIALCPAHDDRRPSLSIKETEDGTVLLHCWTGCGASEIVNALGLSLSELFPDKDRSTVKGDGPTRRPFSCRDALAGIAHESTVVLVILETFNRGEALDREALLRLALAEERIAAALLAATGGAL